MHIQVSGQHKQIGKSLQSAAETRLAAMAAGRFRRVLLRGCRGRDLRVAARARTRARKRLGRYGRYSARSAGFAAHGGLNVVYRRPDGNIGWIDAGPERLARG